MCLDFTFWGQNLRPPKLFVVFNSSQCILIILLELIIVKHVHSVKLYALLESHLDVQYLHTLTAMEIRMRTAYVCTVNWSVRMVISNPMRTVYTLNKAVTSIFQSYVYPDKKNSPSTFSSMV